VSDIEIYAGTRRRAVVVKALMAQRGGGVLADYLEDAKAILQALDESDELGLPDDEATARTEGYWLTAEQVMRSDALDSAAGARYIETGKFAPDLAAKAAATKESETA
jgi:hypothetical protein